MSARHRRERIVEPKEIRVARHRTHRHHVNQSLHQVLLDGDVEDLALEVPVHTAGEAAETPVEKPVGARRLRHWKQPFWKRRTNQRRLKARLANEVVE